MSALLRIVNQSRADRTLPEESTCFTGMVARIRCDSSEWVDGGEAVHALDRQGWLFRGLVSGGAPGILHRHWSVTTRLVPSQSTVVSKRLARHASSSTIKPAPLLEARSSAGKNPLPLPSLKW
eukprot:CAMPEP_0118976470 /NCGR_PEP_ID=MMETSP1173-20130426/18927_1 /TAXON_ID=1034831 /ORGANISM="Rhizochromulina marina cf, Strain CCMP1243" /LENGTH=122 /DNA_ID=CAMNT_0006926511 /DNA_START=363 /DNA_END=728 /DNA_ORIENTATION=+